MNWNAHWDVIRQGKHALLGASKWHWLNYSPEKIARLWETSQQAQRGTELHAFAATAIKLRQKLAAKKQTLNLYVNDAIGYGMTPEQPLYFSENCFGTADTICFKRDFLRIHDLKTGTTKASFHQLEVYTSIFCLEYGINPKDIDIELRIYQMDEVMCYDPPREDILAINDKIIIFDKQIEKIKGAE